MFQVGQVLTLNGTLIGGSDVRYVWKFWDGDVHTTVDPVTQKVLNKGGTVVYEMLAVDAEARVFKDAGSIVVNAPPQLTSVSLSDNDSPAPFDTTLTSAWTDPEAAGVITVSVENEQDVIPSPGISIIPLTVTQTKVVVLSGTDTQGGITRFPIELRVAPTPLINVIGAAEPPVGRIGPGQTFRLTAFAEDQNEAEIIEFQWILETSRGWAVSQTFSAPTDAAILASGGGGFSSFIDIPIATESSGEKTVRLRALTSTSSAEVIIPVLLVANSVPVIQSFAISGTIGNGSPSIVSAVAIDPDNDVMGFAWSFHRPLNVTRIGNPVSVTLTEGSVIEGTVSVTDNFGGLSKREIPRILITSALTANAVRSLAFNYTITAMGYSPVTFAASGLPTGLTLNGAVISGTPQSFGNVDVLITASSADGVDSRTLRIVVSEFTPAPQPPSNLRVNGSANPTYSADQDLVVTFTITNDLPNLEAPAGVLELRTTAGELRLTVTGSSGVGTITVTDTQISAAFGSLPSLVIRAYSIRAGVRSEFYQEIAVTRV